MLLKLFEQATYVRPDLDAQKLTTEVMQEFLKDIVELLSEQRERLETVEPLQISTLCYQHLKSFFNDKIQAGGGDYFAAFSEGAEPEPRSEVVGEEVNDIIMKIELKKFQKLIENRI